MGSPDSVTLKCSTCARDFTHKINPRGGARPKRCWECRDPKNRARDLRRLETKLGPLDEKSAAQSAGPQDDRGKLSERASWPELLAVGLGIDPDPERAAELVDLKLSPDELAQVTAQAKKLQPLIDGQSAALGDRLARAVAVMAIRLRAVAPRMPPQQLPSAIKAIAQAQELITGGARGSYVPITLVVPPIGEDGGTPKEAKT